MLEKNTYIIGLVFSILLFAGCEYEFQDPNEVVEEPVDPQSLVFDKYIALGGSYTAGFMDNALYSEGQRSAYPVLLSEVFKVANPDLTFTIPDVNDSIGYSRTVVVNRTETYHLGRLKFDEPGNVASIKSNAFAFIYDPAFDPGRAGCPHVVRSLYSLEPTRPQDYFAPYTGGEFHNYAIPNVSLVQMFNPGLGDELDVNYSPYYVRIQRGGFNTLIEDALSVDYTFFTMWFGITELSSFALDGGQGFLTSSADFRTRLRSVLGSVLRNKESFGMIATVPNILDFPFFTSTTQNSGVQSTFTLTAQEAEQINEAYWLQGYPRKEYFKQGENHYLIETRNGELRQFQPGKEFVTVDFAFVQDSLGDGQVIGCDGQVTQGLGMGIIHQNEVVEVEPGLTTPKAFPIRGELVLDADEVADLQQRADQYNDEIVNALNTVLADPDDLTVKALDRVALVDMARAFRELKRDGAIFDENGFPIMFFDDGIAGVFSSDGLHVTPKGHAWIANNFIRRLNGRFGTNFREIDLLKIRGNDYDFTP